MDDGAAGLTPASQTRARSGWESRLQPLSQRPLSQRPRVAMTPNFHGGSSLYFGNLCTNSNTALRALSRAVARGSSAAAESVSFQGRQRRRCPAQGAFCGACRATRPRCCAVLTWPPARRRHRALRMGDSPSQSGITIRAEVPFEANGVDVDILGKPPCARAQSTGSVDDSRQGRGPERRPGRSHRHRQDCGQARHR